MLLKSATTFSLALAGTTCAFQSLLPPGPSLVTTHLPTPLLPWSNKEVVEWHDRAFQLFGNKTLNKRASTLSLNEPTYLAYEKLFGVPRSMFREHMYARYVDCEKDGYLKKEMSGCEGWATLQRGSDLFIKGMPNFRFDVNAVYTRVVQRRLSLHKERVLCIAMRDKEIGLPPELEELPHAALLDTHEFDEQFHYCFHEHLKGLLGQSQEGTYGWKNIIILQSQLFLEEMKDGLSFWLLEPEHHWHTAYMPFWYVQAPYLWIAAYFPELMDPDPSPLAASATLRAVLTSREDGRNCEYYGSRRVQCQNIVHILESNSWAKEHFIRYIDGWKKKLDSLDKLLDAALKISPGSLEQRNAMSMPPKRLLKFAARREYIRFEYLDALVDTDELKVLRTKGDFQKAAKALSNCAMDLLRDVLEERCVLVAYHDVEQNRPIALGMWDLPRGRWSQIRMAHNEDATESIQNVYYKYSKTIKGWRSQSTVE